MSSFLKTVALLCAALLITLASMTLGMVMLEGIAGLTVVAVGAVLSLGLLVAIAGGTVVLCRETRRLGGRPDLFLELTGTRREAFLEQSSGFRAGPARRWLARRFMQHDLLPGDQVRVRSLPEVLATLDADGCLDGLPFQPEMVRFCGQEARVFRCLDKIYDYGRTKRMRRLDRCVLISNLRCTGSAHDGCQATCYLIWKAEWLQHVNSAGSLSTPSTTPDAELLPNALVAGCRRDHAMRCQFTELHGCTSEYGRFSLARDLIPLLSGNYSVKAWLVAMLTRLFNGVQGWRGGTQFPPLPALGEHQSGEALALTVGETVTVLSFEQIARTLNSQGKNKGLWFDVEMVKHCGREYQVGSSVKKIIDDATGQMREMKTPCIVLDTVDSTGEGLHFNAQHDPIFWREAWLRRTGPAPSGSAAPAGH